jgi:hypothetical protein
MEERSPLWRGWRGVFSPWRKKREGDRKAAGDGFIPYIATFLLGRG